jgi:hypothetical protein
MDQNRYRPPRSNIGIRNREPGSIPRAVAVGALIDIGGSLTGSIVLAFLYAMMLGLQGHSNDAIQQALTTFERWSPFGVLLTLLGTAMSVLGGYHCARIANRTNYLAPGILSLVSVTAGALLSGGQMPQRELILFSALTVIAIMSGAALYMRKFAEPRPPSAAES